MRQYLLILKGAGMDAMSPEEMQQMLKDYEQWCHGLGEHYLGGQKLENNGALHLGKDQIITDGPFLEPKEIIAGYFLIQADSIDEANRIAQSSPQMGLYQIEVRPLVQAPME